MKATKRKFEITCFFVVSSLAKFYGAFLLSLPFLKAASQLLVPNNTYPKVSWTLSKQPFVYTLQQSMFL